MGKVTISLPDDMIKELDDAALAVGGSFSGQVRMLLEDRKRLLSFIKRYHPEALNPTGVAEDRLGVGNENSGIITFRDDRVFEGPRARVAMLELDVKDGVPAANNPSVESTVSVGMDPSKVVSVGPKNRGAELAKKIASGIPGVTVASGVVNIGPVGEGATRNFTKEEIVEKVKSAKKSTGNTGEVELIKGFWRERYADEAMAKIKAAEMGWKTDEFEIKPCVK